MLSVFNTMTDSVIDLENGEINWDLIKIMAKENNVKNNVKKFHCKKCNQVFYNKNYFGRYPLCDKHKYKQ